MDHKAEIIQKYHQGIPIKVIADDEKVYTNTVYHILASWGIEKRRKEEEGIIEDFVEKIESKTFKERISPEILEKMKENSRSNQETGHCIKYYEWPENWIPKKRILGGE